MSWLGNYLTSSIGRKQIMGLTGIGLYIYLIVHLVGNFGLLAGPETFNRYAHLLLNTLGGIVLPIEIGLLLIFLIHVYLAFSLSKENRRARPERYVGSSKKRAINITSLTMMAGGIGLLLFIIVHVAHFKFNLGSQVYMADYDGLVLRDIHTLVMVSFSYWWYTLFYVVCMVLIASHLAHGVQSSFQSLGLNHPKFFPTLKNFSVLFALFIGGGFSFLAIWAFLQRGAY